MQPMPAMPHICGSTAVCTSAAATAASTTLPPARRMSAPASAASGCGGGDHSVGHGRGSSPVVGPDGTSGRAQASSARLYVTADPGIGRGPRTL